GRETPPAAKGVHRRAGLPVRLLRQRHGDVGQGAAREEPQAQRARNQAGAERAPLPLRLAQPHRARGAKGREGDGMNISRRRFIESGALVVAFNFFPITGKAQTPLPGSLRNNRMLNAWLRIDPKGTVTIFSGKIELGQGVGTALAQIAADELDVDMKRIEMIHGDTALTPNEGQTAGNQSMQDGGTPVRFACAEAREMLFAAAAARLSVPTSDLKVADGTISAPGGATATYWDLAANVDLKREATATAKPKSPAEHKWVGKSI